MKNLLIQLINWLASRWGTEFQWRFQSLDAQGSIQIIKCPYGLYLNFPELFKGDDEAVVMADLFYRSPQGAEIYTGRPYSIKVWPEDDLYGDPTTIEFYGEGHAS